MILRRISPFHSGDEKNSSIEIVLVEDEDCKVTLQFAPKRTVAKSDTNPFDFARAKFPPIEPTFLT